MRVYRRKKGNSGRFHGLQRRSTDPAVLRDRDYRCGLPLTLDNVITGTPPPGRSALDGFVIPGKSEGYSHDPRLSENRPQPYRPVMRK